jgi:hypothetical protein
MYLDSLKDAFWLVCRFRLLVSEMQHNLGHHLTLPHQLPVVPWPEYNQRRAGPASATPPLLLFRRFCQERSMSRQPPQRGLILRSVFAVVTIIAVLLALVGIRIQAAREAARKSVCSGHLCQIQLALLNYHEIYGCFPPAYIPDAEGKPMHSWRVLILPYLERKAIYDAYHFDEPWNGPSNRQLASRINTSLFCCPSGNSEDLSLTDYVVIIGDHTAFPGGKSISLDDIRDGQNTILVAEIANSDINWMEPRDLKFDEMSFQINDKRRPSISGPHPGCALVSMQSSCSGQAISDRVPPEDVRALVTIDGGEEVATDRLWNPKRSSP